MTVRTAVADPGSVATALRHAVHELDPDLPVSNWPHDAGNREPVLLALRLVTSSLPSLSVGIALAAVGIMPSWLQRPATHSRNRRPHGPGCTARDVLKLVVRQGLGRVWPDLGPGGETSVCCACC